MKIASHLLTLFCLSTCACGDYWALCIEDAVASREQDDHVQVDVTLLNCSLGVDRDWPEGKEYCLEAKWIAEGDGEILDTMEVCDDESIPLNETSILQFTSSKVIPSDLDANIEIDVIGRAGGPSPDHSSIPSP